MVCWLQLVMLCNWQKMVHKGTAMLCLMAASRIGFWQENDEKDCYVQYQAWPVFLFFLNSFDSSLKCNSKVSFLREWTMLLLLSNGCHYWLLMTENHGQFCCLVVLGMVGMCLLHLSFSSQFQVSKHGLFLLVLGCYWGSNWQKMRFKFLLVIFICWQSQYLLLLFFFSSFSILNFNILFTP